MARLDARTQLPQSSELRGRNHARRMLVKLLQLVISLIVASLATIVAAQDYPGNKPIKLVFPFPAGGGTDIFARVIGNKLTETLKWVVVVDNKPGAGGNIGIDAGAEAARDGYTL